jgi:hypothetical protein
MTFPTIQYAGKRRIGRVIYDFGPMPSDAILNIITGLGPRYKYNHRTVIASMLRDGQLIEIDGNLHLSDEMKAGFADLIEAEKLRPVVEITPPRTFVKSGSFDGAAFYANLRIDRERSSQSLGASSAFNRELI